MDSFSIPTTCEKSSRGLFLFGGIVYSDLEYYFACHRRGAGLKMHLIEILMEIQTAPPHFALSYRSIIWHNRDPGAACGLCQLWEESVYAKDEVVADVLEVFKTDQVCQVVLLRNNGGSDLKISTRVQDYGSKLHAKSQFNQT